MTGNKLCHMIKYLTRFLLKQPVNKQNYYTKLVFTH